MRIAAACSGVSLLAAFRAPEAPQPQEHELGFPHLTTYLIDTHVSDAARDVISRGDLAVIDAEAGELDRRPLDAIRAARPDGVAALVARGPWTCSRGRVRAWLT